MDRRSGSHCDSRVPVRFLSRVLTNGGGEVPAIAVMPNQCSLSTQTEEREVTAVAECPCDSCLEYSYGGGEVTAVAECPTNIPLTQTEDQEVTAVAGWLCDSYLENW